jgi:uncharacterized membrane protein
MKKWLLVALAVVVVLIATVFVVGALLPRRHVASRTRRVSAPPERVFALLRDVASAPTWRRGVSSVDVLPGEPVRWREHGKNGDILFARDVEEAPHRIVTRIADDSLPFGGTWTFDLAADGDGTRVTITEDGEVKSPVFRFVSTLIIGHTSSIDAFLDDLARATAS